jgi:Tfp pilus assembly protein PilF
VNLFGFNKKRREEKFQITENDKNWVDENFAWLIQAFGYPARSSDQLLFSEENFPDSFRSESDLIGNLIKDLSKLLEVPQHKVSFEIEKDIRDDYGTPYEIQGRIFETDLELNENSYKIWIAHSLLSHPKRILHNLVIEFIKIKLIESQVEFDTGEDGELFIYLAGIYFGFGVILAQNSFDTGKTTDNFWETKWNYISPMPNVVMAYGLALYSKLIELDSPSWLTQLGSDTSSEFSKAINFLTDNPSELYDPSELNAATLYREAAKLYENNQAEEAISELQKIVFLTKDDALKATVYNNIGYYLLRLKQFEKSIGYFHKSIEILPDFGYANDNLGYAFIQVGELEKGKRWLEKAMKTSNNDAAYSFRNLALYYQAKGENKLAEEFFHKAFNNIKIPVDLLELHYSDFLFSQGRKDEGLKYLKLAAEKNEPGAIDRLNSIKNQ